MTKLQDRLEAIGHQRLDLIVTDDKDNDPHRPEIRVWASCHEEGICGHVTLSLSALWGQPIRFADMEPNEARKLARALLHMANQVEHAMNGVAFSRTELTEQLKESVKWKPWPAVEV